MHTRSLRIVTVARAAAPVLVFALTAPAGLAPSRADAQQPTAPARAATGRITGRVVDAVTGAGLADVGVQVVGTTLGTMSGVDGRFTLNNVPAGTATVQARRIGYQAKSVTGILLGAGQTVEQSIALGTATVQLAAIVSTASAERGTVNAALDQQRNATGIVTAVTAEQIARSPDSDAAQAVQRVSGVTVQDGRFVFVRGLGERYTTTQLNGARLPSPDPERKVVPLDIFPSGLLQTISTIKTFTPDQSGDFSGAVVDIRTREFPARRQFVYSASLGANTRATGQTLVSPRREGQEIIGFAGSDRNMPAGLRAVDNIQATVPQQELNRIIGSLRNAWTPRQRSGAPSGSFSASVGGNDPVFGQRFGYLLSGTYAASQEVRDQEVNAVAQPQANGTPTELYRFTGQTGRTGVLWGGLANFSTLLGRNTRLLLNNTYNRSADNEARRDVGYSENLGTTLERSTLRFVERTIRSNQLQLEQQLGAGQSFDVSVTSAGVARREPDRSDVIYALQQGTGGAASQRSILFEGEGAPRRTFSDLTESNLTAALNYKLELGDTQDVVVRAGGMYRGTQRDASNLQYSIFGSLSNDARALPAERIFDGRFTQPNQSNFQIQPLGRGGSYAAEDRLVAGYVMGEWAATDRLRLIGGARVENANIEVTSFLLGDQRVPAALDNTDVLPSLVANWKLSETQTVRLSGTQTLARPEYRELSPVLTREVLGGFNQFGNPNLRRSLIQNVDAKWEWYPNAGEVLSLGVFAKRFADPIERVQQVTSESPQVTWRNAERAENYGFELEARKQLGNLLPALSPFLAFANVTLMRSDITLGDSARAALTSGSRAMVGQAPWVVNTGLTYSNGSGSSSATLLYNVVGPRITAAGVSPLPDVEDRARNVIDLSLRFPLLGQIGARVDARNLLDAPYRQMQGPIAIESYRVGRVFSAGLSWQPTGR
jgi:outer membrane receptor for ferrienterochelin and colicin